MRSIEKEEELLRAFYHIKFKQSMKKITKKTINKVGYEYYTYMHL